ncbi:MAG: type II toxin-antitoxin system VapC family toxin [Nitrospirae bacterium]|nr:type II toxin-antitoxin system VapC family toxin [Nitrospirota bacterium]
MTETVFVDSFAWIAAINKSDDYHEISLKAIETFLKNGIKLITSNYVIIETINALSKAEFRKAVAEFVDKLEKSPSVEIITITDEIYNNAWMLYQQRMDKDWGITDCTSFEVMRIFNIKKAFTNDKHFEQAGYFLVLK